jgi:hypothetical protein
MLGLLRWRVGGDGRFQDCRMCMGGVKGGIKRLVHCISGR